RIQMRRAFANRSRRHKKEWGKSGWYTHSTSRIGLSRCRKSILEVEWVYSIRNPCSTVKPSSLVKGIYLEPVALIGHGGF
ncbi:MAG: hypothetical protein KDK55_04730, partial [Chlamydiia bacterium]|nr:hypothetical protein [Chlamydiia bacterium]